MTHTYMPAQLDRKAAAKAMGKSLPISPKVSIEISNFLRGKELDKAIATLKRVQAKEQPVPYRRFTNAVGHRTGPLAAGRYPVKAAGYFLKLLTNAKANASAQGLSGTLVISHIAANRASEPLRNRAKERVTFKRTHVEVIVTESKQPAKKAPAKKTPAKAPAKNAKHAQD